MNTKRLPTRMEAQKLANDFLAKTSDYNAFIDEGSAHGGLYDCYVVVSRGKVVYSIIYLN